MTDDELSELEECIFDACRVAVRKGWQIMASGTMLLSEQWCCPLGAVLVASGQEGEGKYTFACALLGVPVEFGDGFVTGFDGAAPFYSSRFFPLESIMDQAAIAMGRRFRERYAAGEFR